MSEVISYYENSVIESAEVELDNLIIADSDTAHERSLLDQAIVKGRQVAMGVLGTASFFTGTATAADKPVIESPALRALEQRYDTYVNKFTNPVYVMPFDEYFSSKRADDVCSSTHDILGEATYGLKSGKLDIQLKRKSTMYTDKVVMTSDPTPGVSTPNDQTWETLSTSCSDLVTNEASMQLWELKAKVAKGKQTKVWQRVPGTPSVKLADWQPNAVRNEASGDKAINPVLQNVSGLKLSVPKARRKTPAALKKVYPAIVLHSISKITSYESKIATILPNIPKLGKLTVNAGAKQYGKGGAVTSVGFDGYPDYK